MSFIISRSMTGALGFDWSAEVVLHRADVTFDFLMAFGLKTMNGISKMWATDIRVRTKETNIHCQATRFCNER